jgi:hypothetical protein
MVTTALASVSRFGEISEPIRRLASGNQMMKRIMPIGESVMARAS